MRRFCGLIRLLSGGERQRATGKQADASPPRRPQLWRHADTQQACCKKQACIVECYESFCFTPRVTIRFRMS
jgi:hypothetical protein